MAEKIADDFKGLVDTKSYKATVDDINMALMKEFSELEEGADELFYGTEEM